MNELAAVRLVWSKFDNGIDPLVCTHIFFLKVTGVALSMYAIIMIALD